jgi:DNA adenine methylase
MKPFLKWPGGKRWFVAKYAHLLPPHFGRYIEPFLGSGSVFFHLAPPNALLGDRNSDLIATYIAVRDDPDAVEEKLFEHELNHSHDYANLTLRPDTSFVKIGSILIYIDTMSQG